MATITRFPFVRHLRSEPTTHLMHFARGALRRSGKGLAFWFTPLGASLAEVPLDDRELPFLFHGRSRDFQDVVVQGVIGWRVASPEGIAERVDFTLDPATGAYREQPLEKVAGLITQLGQQIAGHYLVTTPIRSVLEEGIAEIRTRLDEGLRGETSLDAMGIEVVSVRVGQVSPNAEMERALQMPTREQIQQSADEATFSRRALAVEKERAIAENELNNQLELAKREENLIEQRGQNDRRRVTESTAVDRINVEAHVEHSKMEADAEAESIRVLESAKVSAEKERMDIYRTLPSAALMGLAARELAGSIQRIDHVNLSPDMLGPLLQNLLTAGTAHLDGSDLLSEPD